MQIPHHVGGDRVRRVSSGARLHLLRPASGPPASRAPAAIVIASAGTVGGEDSDIDVTCADKATVLTHKPSPLPARPFDISPEKLLPTLCLCGCGDIEQTDRPLVRQTDRTLVLRDRRKARVAALFPSSLSEKQGWRDVEGMMGWSVRRAERSMSKTYLSYDPDQQLLLPSALQEWLPRTTCPTSSPTWWTSWTSRPSRPPTKECPVTNQSETGGPGWTRTIDLGLIRTTVSGVEQTFAF